MSDTPALSKPSEIFRLKAEGVGLRRVLSGALLVALVLSLYFSALRYAPAMYQYVAGAFVFSGYLFATRAITRRTSVDLSLGDSVELDGFPATLRAVEWRGHLAFVSLSTAQGPQHRMVWMGEQGLRREFKLALLRMQAAQARQTMAT